MLTAQKTKLHGMKDARWTTKDKLTQYRGIVKLYTREKTVTEKDAVLNRKRQIEELCNVQKNLVAIRAALDNEINGDRQKLRNTLSVNRCMQLAFKNLPPWKVAENIGQNNFHNRKELDRINYQMNQRTEKLIELKLELAWLEDRGNQTTLDSRLPIEKKAATITAKVEDALLKQQSAIQVRNSYRSIIHIMQKDAIYFDSVLGALKQDGIGQGKCMYRCTELGQLATEYVDDLKAEFNNLEKEVKKAMKQREKMMQQVKIQVEKLADSLHYLVDVENETNPSKKLPKSGSEIYLIENIEIMNGIMMYMKNLTLSPAFADIFPNLQSQMHQRKRLFAFTEKLENQKKKLLKKVQHARLMNDTIQNSMVGTTFDYKEAKANLIQQLNEKKIRIKHLEDLLIARGNVSANIRIALQQLLCLVRDVKIPEDYKKVFVKKHLSSSVIEVPEDFKTDAMVLVNQLAQRLQILMKEKPKVDMMPDQVVEAISLYQRHVEHTGFLNKNLLISAIQDTSLVDEMGLEDSQVYSRLDIKKQSEAIIKEIASHSEEAQVAAAAAKEKKK